MSIEEYFGNWTPILNLDEVKSLVHSLQPKAPLLCPRLPDVFKAFHLCDYHNLRVVIIGQDPYPQYLNGSPIATGIAFANPKDVSKENYSPSLKVIMESVINFSLPHNPYNFDPTLEKWEEQGVLLLNSALTCEKGKVGSHALLWKPFISHVLGMLSICNTGLVFVFMGKEAISFSDIVSPKYHYIIKAPHPSYYARTGSKMPNIWQDINKILIQQNGYGIEWYEEEKN